MALELDDPRLTRALLDELDPRDRAALLSDVRRDRGTCEAYRELEAAAESLRRHFAAAPAALARAHLETVERALGTLDGGRARSGATAWRPSALLGTLLPPLRRGAAPSVDRSAPLRVWRTRSSVAVDVARVVALAAAVVLFLALGSHPAPRFRHPEGLLHAPDAMQEDVARTARALARRKRAETEAPAARTPASSSDTEEPELLSGPTEPSLPAGTRVRGSVLVECVLLADGRPGECRVLRGLGREVDRAVLEMMSVRRYAPPKHAGDELVLRKLEFQIEVGRD